MMSSNIIIALSLFIISFVFGIWLSRLGKPLNVVVFTVHKIAAVLALVFTVIIIYNLQKPVSLGTTEVSSIIVTVLFLLLTVISGVLLSFNKPVNNSLLLIHKISPVITIALSAVTVYLLSTLK